MARPALGRVLVVCGMMREAGIARRPGVELVVSGADPALLLDKLAALDPARFDSVISFGLAGGLDPALGAGALVLGSAVIAEGGLPMPADAALLAALARALAAARIGLIAGVDRPLASPAAKQACRAGTGALAADMESHIAARFATRHGLGFAVLRAISDDAAHGLPPVARVALDADGRLRSGAIIASLMRAPGQITGLPRLYRESAAAFRALTAGWAALAGA